MTIRCPFCATVAPLSTDPGTGGRMVTCEACGTRWLARTVADDTFGLPAVRRGAGDPADVSDAIVIEHIAQHSRTPPPPPPPRRSRQPVRRRRGLRVAGAAVGVLAAVAILRASIVAALPGIGGLPADADQLQFRNVRSETVRVHGVSTLFVEGDIVNHSRSDVALPAIRIALKSNRGDEVESWVVEPSTAGLAPGRSIGFRSALASPPTEASQVTLNLVARQGTPIGPR